MLWDHFNIYNPLKNNLNIIIQDSIQRSKTVKLVLGRCLRLVPRRRVVYEGKHQGHHVIIKVFLSRFRGRRHLRRELKGFKLLRERQIAAPEVLTYGRNPEGSWVLVLEKIAVTEHISSVVTDPDDAVNQKELLHKTVCLLAQMHAAGIWQRDLHLENFLWDGETVYALDPAQMRFFTEPIDKKTSLQQLAGLSMAFSFLDRTEQKALLERYFQNRDWQFNDVAKARIEKLAQKAKQLGIRRSLKKSLRTCTHFDRHKNGPWCGVFERQNFDDRDPTDFMIGLDDLIEAGDILKRGNTCFVSKIVLNGREVVVKRYNHKGLWHSLRYTLKGSRAKKCWLFGHRLKWLGIHVAEPLAYIEQRHFGLIRQSYILNEYIEGQYISEYLSRPDLDEQTKRKIREKTYALLLQIAEHQITHGDLKAANILICDGEPVLIDLDSMKRHRCRWLLKLYRRKMEDKIKKLN